MPSRCKRQRRRLRGSEKTEKSEKKMKQITEVQDRGNFEHEPRETAHIGAGHRSSLDESPGVPVSAPWTSGGSGKQSREIDRERRALTLPFPRPWLRREL
jgi:hypothetical protein